MPKICMDSSYFFMAQKPLVDQGLLIIVALPSHSDTPHSVERYWTSDQPDAETTVWKHTTLTTLLPQAGFEPPSPSKRTATDPRLKRSGHWNRRVSHKCNAYYSTRPFWHFLIWWVICRFRIFTMKLAHPQLIHRIFSRYLYYVGCICLLALPIQTWILREGYYGMEYFEVT